MRLKNINRRKLNNKGFTLIELLAVVVILAIVMGIAATSVLNSINNSRKSSLYSTAQNAANTLNTWISEDMIVTDNDKKKLGDAFVTSSQTNSWICFDETTQITNGGNGEAFLYAALGLSKNDILIDNSKSAPTATTASATVNCSAYRYNKSTGAYEVLLVAKPNGKFWVSNNGTNGANNYAFSRADAAGKDNID